MALGAGGVTVDDNPVLQQQTIAQITEAGIKSLPVSADATLPQGFALGLGAGGAQYAVPLSGASAGKVIPVTVSNGNYVVSNGQTLTNSAISAAGTQKVVGSALVKDVLNLGALQSKLQAGDVWTWLGLAVLVYVLWKLF